MVDICFESTGAFCFGLSFEVFNCYSFGDAWVKHLGTTLLSKATPSTSLRSLSLSLMRITCRKPCASSHLYRFKARSFKAHADSLTLLLTPSFFHPLFCESCCSVVDLLFLHYVCALLFSQRRRRLFSRSCTLNISMPGRPQLPRGSTP